MKCCFCKKSLDDMCFIVISEVVEEKEKITLAASLVKLLDGTKEVVCFPRTDECDEKRKKYALVD